MSLAEAFGPVLAINRAIVLRNTFGHLAPDPHKKYYGYIIVANGIGGNNIIFDYEFEGLPDSPWFAQDLDDFALGETVGNKLGLYKFTGWYKKFKNGNCQFGGGKFYRMETINDHRRV